MKSRRGDAVRISEVHKRIERAAWRAEGLANRTPTYSREERKAKIAELSYKFIEGLPDDEQAAMYHEADEINREPAAMSANCRALSDFDMQMRQKYGQTEEWTATELQEYLRLSIPGWLARQLREKAAEVV